MFTPETSPRNTEADSGEEMGSGLEGTLPLRKWLVTRVETVTVMARTQEQAVFNGTEALDFVGAETTNIEAEERVD